MMPPLHLMIVGAFPSEGSPIVGGIVTSCRVLLESSLPARATLTLLDSSQAGNPPPGLAIRAARAALRLVRFVVRFEVRRPQVVMLFFSPGASTIEKGVMACYARLRGRPVLLLPRGAPPAPHEAVFRCLLLRQLAFGFASHVVCQGQAWQEFVVKVLERPANRAPIVPNWTATPALLAIGRAREVASTPKSSRRPLALLFLGWVEQDKGIFDLLAACERLPAQFDYRLDIVGDGRAAGAVTDWIKRNNMGHRVYLHGWLHGEAKLERLRAADVFVLPSWAEGLPNAMIEAMACQVACVVSSVGNIPATIGETCAAVLVPPRDVVTLAHELQRMIDDPVHRQSVALAGLSLAERAFGAEGAVDRLLSIAQDSLERASR